MRLLPMLLAGVALAVSGSAPDVNSAEENPAAPGLAASPALVKKVAAAFAAKGVDYRPNTRHLDARGRPLFTNRLILETSPYLLQHANNPVSWYAWGDEPFERARREKKPVLLSIGYSTCHWCHVMERESFEDIEIARYINGNYVAIKVDREERPDVDDVYMAAVELLTGSGGWPMTTALTPDRQPFFGGTYFPPRQFLDVLQQLRRMIRIHSASLKWRRSSRAPCRRTRSQRVRTRCPVPRRSDPRSSGWRDRTTRPTEASAARRNSLRRQISRCLPATTGAPATRRR